MGRNSWKGGTRLMLRELSRALVHSSQGLEQLLEEADVIGA